MDIANNALVELERLAEELDAAQREADNLELKLSRAKAKVRDLMEEQIPELMLPLGQEILRTRNGLVVELKDDVHARISADNQPEAHKWLDDHGHGKMIKRKVVVTFDREQEEEARKLLGELRASYPYSRQESKVEPQTLKAWARRQLEDGNAVPEDLFGIYVRKIARITKRR